MLTFAQIPLPMQLTEEQVRLIFGLKLRQIRAEKDLSLFGLSKKTGLSKSYLNEIEKGKKYPKPDKIVALATALETPYDELVSMKLTGNMAPLSDIIMSGVLKEIPLDLFGIEENNLIDIIANAPDKVTAFIGTLFEIARNYDVTREKFYLAALRSYQESRENYFEHIEAEAKTFANRYNLDLSKKLTSTELAEILTEEFGYQVDYNALKQEDFPDEVRSVFIPAQKKLLLATTNTETQRVFILAKELGYAHMGIKQRPLTFTWIKFESFEDVLNNFKASYFAGALMLPEDRLVADLKQFFQQEKWSDEHFLQLLLNYTDSAETFFQRLTNLLPRHFGMKQLFFLRFQYAQNPTRLHLTKEMHLSRSHQPHAVHNQEHYCRRWVSTDLLTHPNQYTATDGVACGVQKSSYQDGSDGYFILAASNADPLNIAKTRSVCIGIELNTRQRKRMAFLGDTNIPERTVAVTCERCSIADCAERVAPPRLAERAKRNTEIEEKIYDLINKKTDPE